jgi:hypothetical protein
MGGGGHRNVIDRSIKQSINQSTNQSKARLNKQKSYRFKANVDHCDGDCTAVGEEVNLLRLRVPVVAKVPSSAEAVREGEP